MQYALANSKEKKCLPDRSKGTTRDAYFKNNPDHLKLTCA